MRRRPASRDPRPVVRISDAVAGLSDEELALAGSRRSLLDRVGGWFLGFRRDRR